MVRRHSLPVGGAEKSAGQAQDDRELGARRRSELQVALAVETDGPEPCRRVAAPSAARSFVVQEMAEQPEQSRLARAAEPRLKSMGALRLVALERPTGLGLSAVVQSDAVGAM